MVVPGGLVACGNEVASVDTTLPLSTKNGGPEGTLLEPAHKVAKLLVKRRYGRIFRLPAFRTTDASELNDEFEYIS